MGKLNLFTECGVLVQMFWVTQKFALSAFTEHSGFPALLTLLGFCQLVVASSGGNR
jgi:hypothetical protein